MSQTWKTVVCLFAALGAVAAAAPKLKSSWRNLDTLAAPVAKVAVIGFTRELATRRLMEDELAAEIRKNGGHAEQSYLTLPGDLPKDPETIKQKLGAAGFDGAAVVRLAGVSQEQSWDPGYLRTDTLVRIETVVYSVNGVMIWTGLSESLNPGSVRSVIRGVAVAAGADMKKRNAIR